MAKLYYQGHASLRIIAGDGRVIYIDPYVGNGYELPADIVLVTHRHGDHYKLELVTKKPGCVLITNEEALAGGKHNYFDIDGIKVEAVGAGNKNHDPEKCVGYIITVDGKKVYISGDTSKTKQMESFKTRELDWALLVCDGYYNMDLEEAAVCAELIGAKHNIPIHMKPGELFDRTRAESFNAPNRVILELGEEVEL